MSQADQLRQKARDFEQRENWKRAIEHYELALEAAEQNNQEADLGLYNRIGDLYRRIGALEKAVSYYERAAYGHMDVGFYNNAIALFNKILRHQPARHSAHLNLGKIAAAKGFAVEARKYFLEFVERMQKAGRLNEAFDALIEFAGLSPDAEIRLIVADQLIEHNRTPVAVEQLRLTWRHLHQEGREADAREVRERIVKLAPEKDPEIDPPDEHALGAGEAEAEGVLDLPMIMPDDEPATPSSKPAPTKVTQPEGIAPRADADRRLPPAERLQALERKLSADEREPGVLLRAADAALDAGEQERASTYLREALELLEREGREREAARVVDELLRLDVDDVEAYQKRVELALRSGSQSRLIEAYLGLADCLDRTRAGEKARLVYRRVLELDPVNRRAAAALVMLGGESVAGGAQAGSDAQARLEAESKGGENTRFTVPALELQAGRDVDFSGMLDRFMSKISEGIDREDAASHYDLGLALKDMGLIDEAIGELQIAARAVEYRLRAIEMLGSCFIEKGEPQVALKVYGRALQLSEFTDVDLVGIFYSMGSAHEALGQAAQALECYERVMTCDARFKDVAQRVATLQR